MSNDTPKTGEERLVELAKEHRELFERVAEVDDEEIAREFGEKPLAFLEEHTESDEEEDAEC